MNNKSKFILILMAIILFYGLTNWLWIKNTSPKFPQCYSSVHYGPLLECFDKVASIGPFRNNFSLRSLGFIFGESWEYPVLISSITATWCLILGRSALSIITANLLYMIILLISAYYIGKKISGPGAGLLSMLFISLFPGIYGPSRIFVLELGEAAFVCLSICALLYSEDFKNTKYSLLFGLSCGLGMLTQEPFITFIIGPSCFVSGGVIFSFFRSRDRSKYSKQLLNIAIALAIVILMSANYYLGLKNYASAFGKLFHEPGPLSATYYIRDLIHTEITPLYFVLLIWGIFVLIKSRDIKIKAIFLLWILIPALIYTFMPHYKTGRYAIPYLPAIGIISAIGISKIKFSLLKNIIIVLAVVYGLLYYSDLSFESNFIPQPIEDFLQADGFDRLSFPPQRQEGFIKIKDEFILPQIKTKSEKSKILFLPLCDVQVEMYIWKINLWSEHLDQQVELVCPDYPFDYRGILDLLLEEMREADLIVSPFDITDSQAFEYLVETNKKYIDVMLDSNMREAYKNDFLRLRNNFKFIAKCEDLFFFSKK